LSETAISLSVDQRLQNLEQQFRALFERALATFLERPVEVRAEPPAPLEFKDLKAALPGDIVFATVTLSDGAAGKICYALTRPFGGIVADMLLMGKGKTNFVAEEHLEPLKDLFREVTSVMCAELGKELGRHILCEESRAVVLDLTPGDFAGAAWVVSKLTVALETPVTIYRIVSREFVTSLYPEDAKIESRDVARNDTEDDEAVRKEMGLVLDIELVVTIELGRTDMLIRDIVKLGPGSIVELDKLSGDPVDLLVNGRKFARGEVVVVDENFAVRLTDLVPIDERATASRN
jgi:flagellar motor switch protein FliN/FliY